MGLHQTLQKLQNHFKSQRRHQRPKVPRPCRLTLERLENRTQPTVLFTPAFFTQTLGAEQLLPTPSNNFNYQTLSSPSVYLIFWGSYWKNNSQQVGMVSTDAQTILGSAYPSGLTKYGSDGKAIYITTYVDTSDPPAGYDPGNGNTKDVNGNTSFSDLQSEIANAINNQLVTGILPPPANGDAIYAVVTPASGNLSYNSPGNYNGTPEWHFHAFSVSHARAANGIRSPCG